MELCTIAIKAGITGVFSALTMFWGHLGWLVVAWIACMALDYISGSLAARKDKAWTSEKARNGLASKGGMILFVLGAATLDAVLRIGLDIFPQFDLPFGDIAPITTLVLIWYIITEIGSLFENAQKLGASFPPGVQKIIETFKSRLFPNDDG